LIHTDSPLFRESFNGDPTFFIKIPAVGGNIDVNDNLVA